MAPRIVLNRASKLRERGKTNCQTRKRRHVGGYPPAQFEAMESRMLMTTWGGPTGLLAQPTWDQGPSYNQYVPIDPATGNRSLVGCVATAEAQVANYWRYPQQLTFGQADDYTTGTRQIDIDGNAALRGFLDFPTVNANFRPLLYDGSDRSKALLSFAVGIKAEMDYTSSASATWVTAETFKRLGFGSADEGPWTPEVQAAVISNIKSGLPVVLAIGGTKPLSGGRTEDIGHAIAIEGYDDNANKFYLNLGWGGAYDGWYSLPPSFSTGTYSWNSVGWVVYNIRPDPAWTQAFGDAQNTSGAPYIIPAQTKDKWHIETDATHSVAGFTVGAGAMVYAAVESTSHPGTGSLWVISDTGVKVDEISLNEGQGLAAPVQSRDGTVFIPTEDGRIYRVDPKTRAVAQIYSSSTSQQFRYFRIGDDGTLYVVGLLSSGDERLAAISQDGVVRWQVSVGGYGTFSVPAIDDSHNRVYVQYKNLDNLETGLVAIDRQSGSVLQNRLFGAADANICRPMIGADGTVYVGVESTYYALMPGNLYAERWHRSLSPAWLDRPAAIGPDGTIYVTYRTSLAVNWRLAAIDPANGTSRWEVLLPTFNRDDINSIFAGMGTVAVTMARDNGASPVTYQIYAYRDSGATYAQMWTKDIGAAGGSLAMGPGDTIYIIPGGTGRTLTAWAPDGAGKGWTNNRAPVKATNTGVASGGTVQGTSANLSWADSDPDGNARTYTLLMGTSDAKVGAMLPIATDLSTASYSLTTLNPGTTYYWKVVATDGQAVTESPTWNFTAAADHFPPPTDVQATDNLSDKVQVTWAAPSGATAFEVWRNTVNNPNTAIKITQSDITGTSYDDTTATADQTYWYWVKAKNLQETSEFSESDSGIQSNQTPYVTGISFSDPLLTDADVGQWPLLITVAYSKPMNTSVAPAWRYSAPGELGLDPSVAGKWTDATHYQWTWGLADLNVEGSIADFEVYGAQDLAGKAPDSLHVKNPVRVDTKNPSPPILTISPQNAHKTSLIITGEPGSMLTVWGGGALIPIFGPALIPNGTAQISLFLADHLANPFSAELTDIAGNKSTRASINLVLHAPPQATLSARTAVKSDTRPFTFTVTYVDPSGIDLGSISTGDVRVTGRGCNADAVLVCKQPKSGRPTTVKATYSVVSRDGIWDWRDSGPYVVTLQKNQVGDLLKHRSSKSVLGSFAVSIPKGKKRRSAARVITTPSVSQIVPPVPASAKNAFAKQPAVIEGRDLFGTSASKKVFA